MIFSDLGKVGCCSNVDLFDHMLAAMFVSINDVTMAGQVIMTT